MSYTTGEAAAKAIAATSDYFNSTAVISLANDDPPGGMHALDSGEARDYIFLRRGDFTSEPLTIGAWETTWTTIMEVWTRYKTPGETEKRHDLVVQDVLDKFATYDRLNSMAGVRSSAVVGGDEPVIMKGRGRGGLTYVRQTLRLVWEEDSEPTIVG